jgi:hypothetical protein
MNGNNDTALPFWVVVENQRSRQRNFYCGAETRRGADRIARERNEQESATARVRNTSRPESLHYLPFKYSVIERPEASEEQT